jgi:catechol 2,3-dioxygenase-like lactoylglutathione lyase family enzyme
VAIKVPERQYAATLAFYRDVIGLPVLEDRADGALIDFGATRLHLDRVPQQRQSDVWFELLTDDTTAAAAHLKAAGVDRCDEVEILPEGFDGFWTAAPSGIIHLMADKRPKPEDDSDG